LLAEMIAAADRGVRVRLLIDDNPTAGLDNMWAAADSHPNIEVRLFNPLAVRKPRAINYLFDPFRLNRRMHNKSITYDSAVSIVGGRNVGDEYFGASSQGLFIDLDALAIGDVVPAIEDEFERYWTSASAFPAGMLLPLPPEGELEHLRNPVFADESLATAYRAAAYDMATLKEQTEPIDGYIWASVRLVADNPAKALDKAEASDLMALQIAPVIAGAKERFDLVSGYFVPSDVGTQLIAQRAIEGAKVRVVTNSIKVTDVPVVHAGYAPWRKPLLQSGVELYEARPLSDQHPGERGDLGRTRFSGGGESVHAKTFAIDNRTVFVGSFNFDPRSALLNCEMGLLIESPEIARAVGQTLDERLGPAAYAVSLDDNGKMRWTAGTGEDARTFDTEPNTTMMDRALIRVLSLLPIEWLL
jgi:putative cardiolipin synthase